MAGASPGGVWLRGSISAPAGASQPVMARRITPAVAADVAARRRVARLFARGHFIAPYTPFRPPGFRTLRLVAPLLVTASCRIMEATLCQYRQDQASSQNLSLSAPSLPAWLPSIRLRLNPRKGRTSGGRSGHLRAISGLWGRRGPRPFSESASCAPGHRTAGGS